MLRWTPWRVSFGTSETKRSLDGEIKKRAPPARLIGSASGCLHIDFGDGAWLARKRPLLALKTEKQLCVQQWRTRRFERVTFACGGQR
jgi:hypothetical protein